MRKFLCGLLCGFLAMLAIIICSPDRVVITDNIGVALDRTDNILRRDSLVMGNRDPLRASIVEIKSVQEIKLSNDNCAWYIILKYADKEKPWGIISMTKVEPGTFRVVHKKLTPFNIDELLKPNKK